jgi:predicted RNA-binding protein with PUA-like domain
MSYWIVATDPQKRSFDDLAKEGWEGSEWSGVRDELAFDHLAAMRKGDLAMIFHGGEERRFFGIARILAPAAPDSTDESGQWLSVKMAVFLRLISPAPLAAASSDEKLAPLVKAIEEGREILPLDFDQWDILCRLGDMPRTPQSG